MTITIPVWVLWVVGLGLGIPAFFVLCAFAWMGLQLTKAFSPRSGRTWWF